MLLQQGLTRNVDRVTGVFGERVLFTLSGTPITVANLITFGALVLVAYGVSRLVQRAITRGIARRGPAHPGNMAVTRRLTHYAIMALGLTIALQNIGIQLSALFAAGAVFAVAIGFGMQNIAQNFISGVILLVERTIKAGDVLEVENRVVRVERMGLRATIARSRDEQQLIIPNSALVQSIVTNYTLQDSLYRIRATVGVSYSSDMAQVRQALERAAAAVPWRVEARAPLVLLTDFGASSVNWEVSVWGEDPWAARVSKSALNEAIWRALAQDGIVISFPQMDVHLDAPLALAAPSDPEPR